MKTTQEDLETPQKTQGLVLVSRTGDTVAETTLLSLGSIHVWWENATNTNVNKHGTGRLVCSAVQATVGANGSRVRVALSSGQRSVWVVNLRAQESREAVSG